MSTQASQFFKEDFAKNSDLYREFTETDDFFEAMKKPGFKEFVILRHKNSRIKVPGTKEEAIKVQALIKTIDPIKNRVSSLIIENINEKFCWALYGDFRVIMMKSNGYINATKLCQLGGKRFDNWSRLGIADELVKTVEKHISSDMRSIEKLEIMILIKTGHIQEVWGTYVHIDLICHIASWISPVFAIIVSKIVNNYYIREREREMENLLEEKESAIKKLEITVNEIKQLNQNQSIELKEIKELNQNQTLEIQKLENINNKQLEELNELKTINLNQTNKINKLYEVSSNSLNLLLTKSTRATVEVPEKENTYVIIMKHNEIQKPQIGYSVIRCQKRNITDLKKKSGGEELMRFENPNAIKLWNRFSTGNQNITKCYSKFTLAPGYSEEQFIHDLESINDEKFNGCADIIDNLRETN